MEEPAPGGSLQRAESLPFLPNSPKTPAGRAAEFKNLRMSRSESKKQPSCSLGAEEQRSLCQPRAATAAFAFRSSASRAVQPLLSVPRGGCAGARLGLRLSPSTLLGAGGRGSASPCLHQPGFAPQGFRILCLSPWQRTSPAVREVWLWVASLRGSARPGSTHGCHPGTPNTGVGAGAIWGAAASFAPPHPR